MKVTVLAFGITREIIGGNKFSIELREGATIGELKTALEERHPALRQLTSLLIAQDENMADPNDPVHEGSELALIPPVSGG